VHGNAQQHMQFRNVRVGSPTCHTRPAHQVSALEELLGFLSSLPALSGLSREALTSLAVFVKPLSAQPGQVLALAGQPADALVIIQVGTGDPVSGMPCISGKHLHCTQGVRFAVQYCSPHLIPLTVNSYQCPWPH
jgi:hypothetical protein